MYIVSVCVWILFCTVSCACVWSLCAYDHVHVLSFLVQVLTGGKERPDILGQALRDKSRHWDFVIKEMMWMADDFQQERKRHMVSPGSRLAGLSAIEPVKQQTASAGTVGNDLACFVQGSLPTVFYIAIAAGANAAQTGPKLINVSPNPTCSVPES